jgi:hypothetical protein
MSPVVFASSVNCVAWCGWVMTVMGSQRGLAEVGKISSMLASPSWAPQKKYGRALIGLL